MSQIEKLKITGVRSFDNAHSEVIWFHAPLTLIVGYNGSGKTTIIECLKFATTGQLPPNSKGGAFVHDPKLCGEKEVMAQVQLQFKDGRNAKMVATRSLQLTVKKAGRSVTQVDCNLLMKKDGERTSLSKRVAQMNDIVPKYLGVSPAILETVIFCHQDESLWPMSEPLTLKRKFDEIFEAMKYTKAMDNLKKVRKSQMDNLTTLKVHEENFKSLKDKAEKVEKKSHALEAAIDKLKKELKELDEEIDTATITKQEKQRKADQARTIVEELKQKKFSAEFLQKTVDDIKDHMTELQESDEWLESTLAQYDERMAEFKEQQDDYSTLYSELKENAAESTRSMSKKQAEQGQLMAQKETHEDNIESRIQLVREAANHHSMRGYDGDLDENEIREFVARIEKLSRDKDRELEIIRKTMDNELWEKQNTIMELKGRRSSRVHEKVTAKQTIASNDKKTISKQNAINSIAMDVGTKTALEVSLQGVQGQLQKLNSDFVAAEWEKTINTEQNRVRELEDEAARLRNELMQSNKLVQANAQLELFKTEAKDRRARVEALKSTYDDQISSVVGPSWSVDNLESVFQQIVDEKSRAVAQAKEQQEGSSRELSSIDFKLTACRGDLKQKKDEMQKCITAVLESIPVPEGEPQPDVDDYPSELAHIEEERGEAQKGYDGAEYVEKYYRESIDIVNKHNCCKLCARKFADKTEQAAAVEKINRSLAKSTKKKYLENLRILDADYQKADAARTQYDMYKSLSTMEVPALEKNIGEIESQKSMLVERLERQDRVVSDLETIQRDVNSLTKTVNLIIQYSKELANYENNITRHNSQQRLTGSSLTTEEINQQSTACAEQTRTVTSKINKLRADKEQANSAINNLQREENDLSQKLHTAKFELEKKDNLMDAIRDLRDSTKQMREDIQKADQDLESLAPEMAKAEAQHEDIQKRGRAKEKEIQITKDDVAKTVHKFRLLDTSINKYIKEDGPGKLASCQCAIKSIEQEQKHIESETTQVTKKANELKKRVDDSENTRKSIGENLRYREKSAELRQNYAEIDELNARNVEEDCDELEQEANDAVRRHQNLLAERGPITGQMKGKDDELLRCVEEWETDYRDAAEQYREAHVKVELTKAACEDLAKYLGALDSAIMKYHSLKMEEINQIAGEYWQRTYQGTDVDTIMIRSEGETKQANRSYNYRVVMVKGDAELDMRGRCSAGQKVLASIIIRLALAECFGINCGVIALDEPTTNLDRDNIKALAESLHSIIYQRRHQANFQLIIITHDEEFLRDMNCSDFTEDFYKVSRDNRQKSMIRRQALSELM